jgi:hypothetical protein
MARTFYRKQKSSKTGKKRRKSGKKRSKQKIREKQKKKAEVTSVEFSLSRARGLGD